MIESSTICILHNGRPFGTGFLIAKDVAVTCAHVVESAGETLHVRFTGREEILPAEVLREYQRDPNHGDIAFLRLGNVPAGCNPLSMGAAEHSFSGNSFQAFGYPTLSAVEGVHARGEILGMVTEEGQRLLQLRSMELNQGHSGSPVWDEQRGIVVGMVVSVYKSDASGKLRDTAFAVPSETLWQVYPAIGPSETAPYRGLETFTEETADFFFGRQGLTKKLLKVLRGGNRFLAVLGPSGSGKSSVVRAGVLPALKAGQVVGSKKWAQIIMRPADDPFAQLQAAGLEALDVPGYLRSHAKMERVVLFIDQFEELFTLCPEVLRERFVRDLAAALENSRLILILCMRDDFYSAFNAQAASLAESEHLKIENVPGILQHNELIEIIEQPAMKVRLSLEKGLTESIIKDLRREGEARSSTLPLLEFALTQLWERRRDGRLTHEAYEEIGGATGSLASWADDAYNHLPKTDQVTAESLLTSLVHLGDEVLGLPDTRKRRMLTEFGDSAKRLIKHFVDRRLIVTSGDVVELIHDALVREWGRLQDWIKKDRENLRLMEGISDAARQWEAGGGDESLLTHRGARLELALAMSKLPNYQLNLLEQTYLNKCLEVRERERAIASRRRRITFTGITVALSVITVILTALAITYRQQQQQARLNSSRELAAHAISQLQFEPELSLLLAVEANQVAYNPEAEIALRESLNASHLVTEIVKHTGEVWHATYSPDGLYFVTTSTDKTARIWDAKTHQPIGPPLQHEHFVERAVISPLCPDEQQYVLTAGRDGTTRIWDLRSGNLIRAMTNIDPDWETYGVAISPDCKYIATGNEHGLVVLWDFAGNTLRMYYTGDDQTVNTAKFSPDGQSILAASNNGNAYIWEVVSNNKEPLEPKLKLVGHSDRVLSASYSRSGAFIVTASQDKTARVWKSEDGELIWELRGHTNGVWYADFSPDVNFLVTASLDGSIRLWSTLMGAQIAEFRGHKGAVYSAEFSPDGKHLLTSSADKTARVWQASRVVGQFYLHGDWLSDVDFSPNGQLLATAGLDNKAIIWNIAGENLNVFTEGPDDFEKYLKIQNLITELPHESSVNSISFSPDGNFVVTSSGTEAMIWDIKTGSIVRKFIGHTEEIYTTEYSPNGELLLTTSRYPDNTARIWNANTGELLTSYPGPEFLGGMIDASFSPDGKYIVTAVNNGVAMVWNVDLDKAEITDPLTVLTGHTQAIFSVVYSHNGRYILTSGDNTARIWDANTGQIIRILRGHDDIVYKASFDRDDKFVVTAGGDYRAIVWDVSTGKRLTELRDHAGPVTDATFSSDGKYIVTASQDNIARLFRCDMCGSVEDLLTLAKSRVPREMTCEERQIYLHQSITCPTPTP
jgi:WD40 repeat protein